MLGDTCQFRHVQAAEMLLSDADVFSIQGNTQGLSVCAMRSMCGRDLINHPGIESRTNKGGCNERFDSEGVDSG